MKETFAILYTAYFNHSCLNHYMYRLCVVFLKTLFSCVSLHYW